MCRNYMKTTLFHNLMKITQIRCHPNGNKNAHDGAIYVRITTGNVTSLEDNKKRSWRQKNKNK